MTGRRRRDEREESPTTSLVHSTVHGHNIQIGRADRDVVVLLDRTDYRLDALQPTPVDSGLGGPVPRSRSTPSYLLDPRREMVPYHPRRDVERQIHAWCSDDEPVSLLWVSGPGGQGKTRLAGHLATDLHRSGWSVVQASDKRTALPKIRTTSELDGLAPLFVVVDYADRWEQATLCTLVEDLAARHSPRKVRLLLLARAGREVWSALSAQLDRADVDIADPLFLGPVTDDTTVRDHLFRVAADVFAGVLGLTSAPPTPQDLDRLSRVDAAGLGASILDLHMRALAEVCAARDAVRPPPPLETSAFLLRHERRYWPDSRSSDNACELQFPPAVMLATLFGPAAGTGSAAAILTRARVVDGNADAERLLHAHRRRYGPSLSADSNGLSFLPLVPDRLGEDMVGEHLAEEPDAVEKIIRVLAPDPDSELGWNPEVDARRCLVVISAAAARHSSARQCLLQVLVDRPVLAGAGTGDVLRFVVDHASDELAMAVEAALPELNTELIGPALDLASRVYDARRLGSDAVALAEAANHLAVRLNQAGRRTEAEERAREAVHLARAIVEREPWTRGGLLASTLTTWGIQLSDLGRWDDALTVTYEAVELLRESTRSAVATPSVDTITDAVVAFRGLSLALNNIGIWSARIGRADDALDAAAEAVSAQRALMKFDSVGSRSDFAKVATNFAARLEEVGRQEEALEVITEAVQVWRSIAAGAPAAYKPGLATALKDLGSHLSLQGRREEAFAATREAAFIFNELVQDAPASYRHELARTLNDLGLRYCEVGRAKDGVGAALEAVNLFREMAGKAPNAFRDELAGALSNLGVSFAESGRTVEALAVTEEAVKLSRELFLESPDAHRPRLAKAVNNLGFRLAQAGRHEEAVAAAREAVEFDRVLARGAPAVYLSSLGKALNNLGVWLGLAGRPEEAVQPSHEALQIFIELARAQPDLYRPEVARAYKNLGHRFRELVAVHPEMAQYLKMFGATLPPQLRGGPPGDDGDSRADIGEDGGSS